MISSNVTFNFLLVINFIIKSTMSNKLSYSENKNTTKKSENEHEVIIKSSKKVEIKK